MDKENCRDTQEQTEINDSPQEEERNVSKVLSMDDTIKKPSSLFDMIFNKQKRKETYDYFDRTYEETEDEKEIFRMISKRSRY